MKLQTIHPQSTQVKMTAASLRFFAKAFPRMTRTRYALTVLGVMVGVLLMAVLMASGTTMGSLGWLAWPILLLYLHASMRRSRDAFPGIAGLWFFFVMLFPLGFMFGLIWPSHTAYVGSASDELDALATLEATQAEHRAA